MPISSIISTLRVPVHRQADDSGHRYGCWAAGPHYRASFHDGFGFHPVLGKSAPRHLPLAMRVQEVRMGDRSCREEQIYGRRCSRTERAAEDEKSNRVR